MNQMHGFDWVSDVKRTEKGSIVIEVRYHDITFEDLEKISNLFQTKKINLDNDVREGGYCETCRYSYSVTVLTVIDPVLPEGFGDV